MERDKTAAWTEIDQHLKEASRIVCQLSPVATRPSERVESGTDWLGLYQKEEQRANEAVARLSKLKREAKLLQQKTKESIARIQSLAYRDGLTGVANLHLLRDYLRSLTSVRAQGCDVVLILIDLDRFHVVNEVLGREIGDLLLIEVARRLTSIAGPGDALGRRGEDEFMLVLSNVPSASIEQCFLNVAGKVRTLLATPVELEGQKFQVTASVGGSCLPTLASDIDDLIEQADSALTYVKKQGRDQSYFYSPQLKVHLKRHAALEFQMPRAMQTQEFFIEYQPILRLTRQGRRSCQSLVGAEAVVFWNNRVEGVLPPEVFLPTAEESGFVVPLGEWVLEQVCHQIREWQKEGLELFVGINLSGRQLLQANMVDHILARTHALGVEPTCLAFEFRESHATLNEEYIDRSLTGLTGAGFSLTLDKFGSGVSSLNRLAKARYVKLSADLTNENRALCQSALKVAAELNIEPIAVGVESEGQAEVLVCAGCSLLQGAHYSPSLNGRALLDYGQSLVQGQDR